MATPFVSGTVALLLNKYDSISKWRFEEKKLVSSCIDLNESTEKQGGQDF